MYQLALTVTLRRHTTHGGVDVASAGCRSPGLSHHQQFPHMKDVCVVVESLHRLEPPPLVCTSRVSPSQLGSVPLTQIRSVVVTNSAGAYSSQGLVGSFVEDFAGQVYISHGKWKSANDDG
jgi:hypothetical protein